MAKYLARIVIYGAQSIGRAMVKSVMQEIAESRVAAKQYRLNRVRSQAAEAENATVKGISLREALEILNVKDVSYVDEIQKNYKHLFQSNSKACGGSLYIQSKVFRAKERIDTELKKRSQLNQKKNANKSA